MKKTFKPMHRTEKASHVYKKKTLNVNDELNIRHDEDDLENVDDYWLTAVSMIGNQTIDSMDDTAITTQSDTLFNLKNIRQSLKGGISKTDLAGEPAPRNGGQLLSKKRLTLKPEENDSDEYVNISTGIEEKENNLPEADTKINGGGAIENDAPTDISGEQVVPDGDNEEQFENYDNEGPDSFLGGDDFRAPEAEEEFDISDTKHTNSKKEWKKQMARSKLIFNKSKARKPESSIVVQDIKSVSALNKIRPLVCTEEINTAIMELDFLAYTNEESSEKAFSIFVLRGVVEIQTGKKTALLRKGEATVVGESDVYSLSCKSKNGASLFLSYAL